MFQYFFYSESLVIIVSMLSLLALFLLPPAKQGIEAAIVIQPIGLYVLAFFVLSAIGLPAWMSTRGSMFTYGYPNVNLFISLAGLVSIVLVALLNFLTAQTFFMFGVIFSVIVMLLQSGIFKELAKQNG